MPTNLLSVFGSISPIDWLIIFIYLLISLSIGVYFVRRAGTGIASYFVSGRNLPWWVLGTSMVATTFAADTPLAVTGWVRTEGIWKNWFWWNYIFSHVFIVFVFSRLWRRAEVITDNEFIELRYSGKPAAFLRGFKAFYFSTIFNFVVMGWVISAMAKFFQVFFGVDTVVAVVICIVIALTYTMLSGLWGVVITDFLQYIIALSGTIILAVVVINSPEVGGMSGFIQGIRELPPEKVSFFITPEADPSYDDGFFSSNFFTFLVFFTVVWWSSHNADGGGYFIQRISSARNERHAVLGMAWFTINHYVIRFWPWVVVALASLIVFPSAAGITDGDEEAVYVYMIKSFLGPGLTGLLLVTFLSAFMSTISTQLNWGASYLINDIYKRFLNKSATETHYVAASRVATVVLMIIAGVVAFSIKNIGSAWIFLWAMSSGIGLVLILRWFWWRINAWSEIVALATSLITICAVIIYTKIAGVPLELHHQVIVIPVSIISWLTATYFTKPEPLDKLTSFYRKVKPWGFWSPVISGDSTIKPPPIKPVLINWIAGSAFVFFTMMAVGKCVMGYYIESAVYISISLVSALVIYFRKFYSGD